MASRKLRVGVIGAGKGHSSTFHGPALQKCKAENPDGIELAWICDLDEERARSYAETFGFGKWSTSFQSMIKEDRPDALLAITPLPVTARVTAELLPYRIPLLIEKPPAENSTEIRRLVDLATKSETYHMISFNRRFNPAILKAQEWLSSFGLPEPHLLVGRMLRGQRLEPNFAIGTGIHLVDAVFSIMGRPQYVQTTRMRRAESETWNAQVSFEKDRAANITIAPHSGIEAETYELIGEGYRIFIDVIGIRAEANRSRHGSASWQFGDMDTVLKEGTLEETRAFLDAARSGKPAGPNLEDALVDMLACESIQSGSSRALNFKSRPGKTTLFKKWIRK